MTKTKTQRRLGTALAALAAALAVAVALPTAAQALSVGLFKPGSDTPIPGIRWQVSSMESSYEVVSGDDGWANVDEEWDWDISSPFGGQASLYGAELWSCSGNWELDGDHLKLTADPAPSVVPSYFVSWDAALVFEVTGNLSDGSGSMEVTSSQLMRELVAGEEYVVREKSGVELAVPNTGSATVRANDDGTVTLVKADPGWSVSDDGYRIVADHDPLQVRIVTPTYLCLQVYNADGSKWYSGKRTGTTGGECLLVNGAPGMGNTLLIGKRTEITAEGYAPALNLFVREDGSIVPWEDDANSPADPANPWDLSVSDGILTATFLGSGNFAKVRCAASDDSASLGGATLELTDTNGTSQTVTTDDGGHASFKGLVNGGTYELSCTAAPEGYVPSAAPVTVTYDAATRTLAPEDGNAWPDGYAYDGGVATCKLDALAPDPAPRVVVTVANAHADGTPFALGETIQYTVSITSSDIASIEQATVSFPVGTGDAGTERRIGYVAMGEKVDVAFEHTVTEDDILAGTTFTATASVSGLVSNNSGIFWVGTTCSCDAELDAPAPALEVTKEVASEPADGVAYKVGEAVEYAVTVTNTGNVTLRDVVVDDPTADSGRLRASATIPTLAPGASAEVSFTHVVTDGDVEAARGAGGMLSSTVTATAADAGAEAEADAAVPVDVTDPAPVDPGDDPDDPATGGDPAAGGSEPAQSAKPAQAAKPAGIRATPATGDAAAACGLVAASGAAIAALGALRRRRA